MIPWFTVFFFGFTIDFLWAFYITFVNSRKYGLAAGMTMLMGIPSLNGYISVYEDRELQWAWIAGLGAGTFAGLHLADLLRKISERRAKRREKAYNQDSGREIT